MFTIMYTCIHACIHVYTCTCTVHEQYTYNVHVMYPHVLMCTVYMYINILCIHVYYVRVVYNPHSTLVLYSSVSKTSGQGMDTNRKPQISTVYVLHYTSCMLHVHFQSTKCAFEKQLSWPSRRSLDSCFELVSSD